MFNWDTDAKIITNRQLRICANKTVHQLGTVKLREGSLTALFVLLSWLLSLTRLGRAHGETAAAAAPMRNIVTSDATSLKLIKTYSARGSQGDRSASPQHQHHILYWKHQPCGPKHLPNVFHVHNASLQICIKGIPVPDPGVNGSLGCN